jgi:hypothetical protein
MLLFFELLGGLSKFQFSLGFDIFDQSTDADSRVSQGGLTPVVHEDWQREDVGCIVFLLSLNSRDF